MSRKERIEQIINENLNPNHLEIYNESHMHHVPKDSETHFKLIIVADKFGDLNRIERHRLVNKLLKSELDSDLHALSLHLFNSSEWNDKGETVLKSPACRDGYKNG